MLPRGHSHGSKQRAVPERAQRGDVRGTPWYRRILPSHCHDITLTQDPRRPTRPPGREARYDNASCARSMAPNLWVAPELANPDATRQHDSDDFLRSAVGAFQREIRENPRPRLIQVPSAVSWNQFNALRRRAVKQADIHQLPAVLNGGTSDPVRLSMEVSRIRPRGNGKDYHQQPIRPHGMVLPC